MAFSPLIGTYTADKVAVSFKGVPISGFADGDAIMVARQQDSWIKRTGITGSAIRSRVCDDGYDITLSLLPTSESIGFIESQRILDEQTGKGAGLLSITDLNSGSNYQFPNAYVRRAPDDAMGQERGNVTYTFEGVCQPVRTGITPTPIG